ncbi:mRNA decay activator protein ZFP36L2 isoform X2 [Agrilus planipennis]|uniref:mRNA decay activator protein ZFP36L2 isoform X2 n=1 Tax=Agrilus planipennis TaxID=224129 RepID=A0A1W4X199_AGRPL|nr:mRNA decay activator protein ZFP36L2 isoform X2 [Agrilus planipennis]
MSAPDVSKNAIPNPDTNNSANNLALNSQTIDAYRVRYALTRMSSTPATASASAAAATTNLVNNILGNLSQQVSASAVHQQHRRLERTQSAPAPNAAALSAAAASVNTSRYKTELCRPFEEFGVCKYGDKCQFAHGAAELRTLARHPKYKTELCRTYHTVGFCPYGPRCHFVHNQDEAIRATPTPAGTAAALIAPRQQQQTQHHHQQPRSRPAALSPSLSLESPSSPCSLSQSPTSSLGSFFSSEPELHSPGTDDQRLPVFNRIAAPAPLLSWNELLL